MHSFILVVGTPRDGFEFLGPFDSVDAAVEYAEDREYDYWWAEELCKP